MGRSLTPASAGSQAGTESFTDVKLCSGSHDYNLNRLLVDQMLRHYLWVLECGTYLLPDGAFHARRMRQPPAPVVALPPTSFARYCRDLCRVVGDGDAASQLELLFRFYARREIDKLSWPELRLIALGHVSVSGNFARDGALKNSAVPALLEKSFRSVDADEDGFITLAEYQELWRRHRSERSKLKVDLEVLLRDALATDAEERALLTKPFAYERAMSLLVSRVVVPSSFKPGKRVTPPRGRPDTAEKTTAGELLAAALPSAPSEPPKPTLVAGA